VGVLHVDTPNRDSLACDLMEPVRPQIDAYLLDWITRQPLKRDWFFEQRDGNPARASLPEVWKGTIWEKAHRTGEDGTNCDTWGRCTEKAFGNATPT
jgi:hypothetical protein